MENKDIGLFLKDLRIKNSLSQGDVAKECCVTNQAVSKWERGDSIPDISTLQKLSVFYEISIDDILNGKVIENKIKFKNNNLEIVKLTISILMFIVFFFPFAQNVFGDVLSGYEIVFEGIWGFNILSVVLIFMYLILQIVYAIFILTKVVSENDKIIYTIKFITLIIVVLIIYNVVFASLFYIPLFLFLIYFISFYMLYEYKLKTLIENSKKNRSRFSLSYFLLSFIYFVIMSIMPINNFYFQNWMHTMDEGWLILMKLLYLISTILFVIGIQTRNYNYKMSKRLIEVNKMFLRVIHVIILIYAINNSHFFDLSMNRYDGIIFVALYLFLELVVQYLPTKFHDIQFNKIKTT